MTFKETVRFVLIIVATLFLGLFLIFSAVFIKTKQKESMQKCLENTPIQWGVTKDEKGNFFIIKFRECPKKILILEEMPIKKDQKSLRLEKYSFAPAKLFIALKQL